MNRALAILALIMVGCSSEVASSGESAVTESAANEPAFGMTINPGNASDRKCPYAGGCDGDVHPTSGQLTVGGKDCGIDGVAATLKMDPAGPEVQNLTWKLVVTDGSCGAFELEGPHFEKYPAKGLATVGDAEGDGALKQGPSNHVPSKILGTASVGGETVEYRFYFGDEK